MAVDSSKIKALVGKESAPIRLPDAVTKSDIRHWCEVIGDPDPDYVARIRKGEKTAPPLMAMAWAMPALWPPKEPSEPHEKIEHALSEGGYPVILGVGLEQDFKRPIHIGDRLSYKVKVEGVSAGEQDTRMGRGYLVDLLYSFQNQAGELVSTHKYKLLALSRLAPRSSAAAAKEA